MSTLIDLKDMPGADLSVTNGMDSVSRGLVKMSESRRYYRERHQVLLAKTWPLWVEAEWKIVRGSPHCVAHGSMNRVSKDGIYRCMTCHAGAYLKT